MPLTLDFEEAAGEAAAADAGGPEEDAGEVRADDEDARLGCGEAAEDEAVVPALCPAPHAASKTAPDPAKHMRSSDRRDSAPVDFAGAIETMLKSCLLNWVMVGTS